MQQTKSQARLSPALFFILVALLQVPFTSYAQQVAVQLKAVNTKRAPIAFASFTITNNADSQQVYKQVADSSGVVYISLQKDQRYRVGITAVNYQEQGKGILVGKQISFVFELIAISKTLGGVTVVSKKALMRQEDDKTIVEPENLAAVSTNAYEVVEKVPGLFVDQDGNIYLSSTTPAMVYINGREMKMSAADVATMLKSLPPGAIAKIEVLRTPSAKYDASGSGGIVNVVLKKGVKIGLTGSVNAGMQQGVYGNQFAGINLNNNNGKRTTYMNFQYAHRDSYEQIETKRRFAPDSLLSQNAYTRYPAHNLYLGYGVNWELSKKWEFSYDGRISHNNANNTTNNQSLINKVSTAGIITNNLSNINNKARTWFISQGISFKQKIDTLGSEWTGDFAYNYNSSNTDQKFVNSFFVPAITGFSGDGTIESKRHFITLQTDLRYKLPKQLVLELGAKSSFLQFDNTTDFFRQSGSVRTKDNVRTNTFKYNENINAGYIQASKTISGIVIKAGVRAENTNMRGRQLIPADTSFTIHRTDLFPYVYISRDIMKIAGYPLKAYAIYRRTISRPVYDYLNPFPRFIDQYLTETGNPSLRPQFTQNVEANVSVDDMPILAVGHNYTKDIFTNVIYQADTGRSTALRTYDNLGTNREVYFRALGAVPPGKRYFFVIGVQYNHNYYNGLYENKPLAFKRGSWSMFTYQTFRIDQRSTVILNGFIRLKGQQQFYELSSFGALGISLNRQFLKKKLTVTLSGNDMLYTNRNKFTLLQGTVNANGERRADTRRFGINLRYNFGVRKKEEGNNILRTESPEKATQ